MKFESFNFSKKQTVEPKEEKTVLEKMRSIPKGVKTGLVAGALSLSSLESQASNDVSPIDTKNPEKTQTYQEQVEEKGKTASFEVFQQDSEREFTLNISNAFETDSSLVKPESAQILEMELQKFWSKLTPETINSFVEHPVVVYSSCDEDRTNAYEGGNAELAQLRAEQGEKLIEESLEDFDFSSHGFSAEDIQKIKNIDIVYNIPEYGGYEKGVTPLTKIVNQETGVFYTQEELSLMNPQEREDLKQKARWVKIEVEGLRNLEVKEQKNSYEDRFTLILKLLNQYDDVSLLVDNSPSMSNSQELLRKTISESTSETPVLYAPFSRDVGELVDYRDQKAVEVSTNKLIKQTEEFGLDAAIKMSGTLEGGKKHAIVVMTDESLQGITKRKLEEIKSKEDISVYFFVLDDAKQNYKMLTLEEIESMFDVEYQKRKQKLENNTSLNPTLKDKELNDRAILIQVGQILS